MVSIIISNDSMA